MTDNQKIFSTIIVLFVIATLLSCFSPVSSLSVQPRITRTNDAIIFDFADEAHTPFDGDKPMNNPEVIPLSSIDPYVPSIPKFQNGWFYSFGYPSQIDSPHPVDAVPSEKQLDEELGDEFRHTPMGKQLVQVAPAPAPAAAPAPAPAAAPAPAPATCGRGPAAMPETRSLISERISGGAESRRNAWPFMVVLLSSYKPICGGALISDTRVLLAAQCLERLNSMDILSLSVSIGLHSATSAPLSRRITRFVLHSQYNAATYANDIAIITLDAPVPFSRTVGPVCLPPASTEPDQYSGQDAIVLGWDASTVLQQGKVSIAANEDCRATPGVGQFFSNATICVTSETVFTCTKDIGGPVVIAVPPTAPATTPVTWRIVGINSYTDPACDTHGPKTRVSAYRDWIQLYMI